MTVPPTPPPRRLTALTRCAPLRPLATSTRRSRRACPTPRQGARPSWSPARYAATTRPTLVFLSSPPLRRAAWFPLFLVFLLFSLAAAPLNGVHLLPAARAQSPATPILLTDDFTTLDPARWTPVRLHDTRSDLIASRDGRLVLGLDTLGSDDATVKLRGVRLGQPLPAPAPGRGLRVTATFDWNAQPNGCYLTMGLALLPAGDADTDPRQAADALAFELVGVPPGRNVRPSLWRRQQGGLRPLYTEGWPQPRREDRTGRPPRPARFALEVRQDAVALLEDGRELWRGPGGLEGPLTLLLFVTGHSNYPERIVHFDDLTVEETP